MAASSARRPMRRGGSTGSADRTRRAGARTSGRSPTSSWPRCSTKMGHEEDARAVMMVKERLQRRARRVRANRPVVRGGAAGAGRVVAGDRRLRAQAAQGGGSGWRCSGRWGWRSTPSWRRATKSGPNGLVQLRSPEWVLCGVPTGRDPATAIARRRACGSRGDGAVTARLLLAAAGGAILHHVQPLDLFARRTAPRARDRAAHLLVAGHPLCASAMPASSSSISRRWPAGRSACWRSRASPGS